MFKAKLTDRATQVRFLRFVIVGLTTAAVNFSLLGLLASHYSPTTAFSGAYVGALICHYLLNRYWALPSSRTDGFRQLVEYLLGALVSYTVNLGAFQLGRLLGLSVMWAALFAIPPSMVIAFLILNFRVFRKQVDHGRA